MSTVRVFQWQEILTVVHIEITPEMLIQQPGVILSVKCQLKGESPRYVPPSVRDILFDRDFVEYKLRQLFKTFDSTYQDDTAFIRSELETDEAQIELIELCHKVLQVPYYPAPPIDKNALYLTTTFTYKEVIERKLLSDRQLRKLRTPEDELIDRDGSIWNRYHPETGGVRYTMTRKDDRV